MTDKTTVCIGLEFFYRLLSELNDLDAVVSLFEWGENRKELVYSLQQLTYNTEREEYKPYWACVAEFMDRLARREELEEDYRYQIWEYCEKLDYDVEGW